MFTFMDKEIVVVSLVGLFAIFLLINSQRRANQPFKVNLFFKVVIILVILAPFIAMYDAKSTASENISFFKSDAGLKCETTTQSSYLVSKASGWTVHQEVYFLKDSLLIRADKCEREQ